MEGLRTYDYLMHRIGNVRKLNRTLSQEEYDRSCCALEMIEVCLTTAFEEYCSFYEGAMATFTKNLKFYLNAMKLFQCDESACNFGNVLTFSFLVLVCCLIVLL